MAKKKHEQLFIGSIYLHKLGTKFDEVIDSKYRVDIIKTATFHSPESGSGKIFEFEANGQKPDWEKYVTPFDGEINLSKSVNNSAIVTIYVKQRLVSLAFGFGGSKLNSGTLVSDFGRKASINLVDPDTIREVSDVTVSETTVQTRKQNVGSKNSKSIFSKDPASFVKGVSGKSYPDWDHPFTIGAYFSSVGASLKVKCDLQIEKSLKSLLNYILDAYDRGVPPELSFMDNITPIDDKNQEQGLWDMLYEEIINDQLTNFAISFPDSSDSTYNSERIPDRHFDLKATIPGGLSNKLIDVVQKNNLTNAWLSYKVQHGTLEATDEYDNSYKAPLNKSIIAELDSNGNYFVLLSNVWYKVNYDFLKDLDREIATIQEPSSKYPDHNSKDEKSYFPVLEQTFGWANIDLRTYSPKDGTMDKVEVADFVSKNHEFTHVKYGHTESSKLSHLFLQGSNSGQLMSQYGEQGFIDKLNDLLAQHNFPPTSLDESGRKIRFLIMKSAKTKDTIPLFSKISLRNTKRTLEALHFAVSYALVER